LYHLKGNPNLNPNFENRTIILSQVLMMYSLEKMKVDTQTDLIKRWSEDYIEARNKKDKSWILDYVCLNSDYSRKYVIRTIRSRADSVEKEPRKRKPAYDGEVSAALIKIWESLDRPCGQRLKPILEKELTRLVQSGQLIISDEVAGKLKKISSATIDRKLKQPRSILQKKAIREVEERNISAVRQFQKT
jgi:hypothetical protein